MNRAYGVSIVQTSLPSCITTLAPFFITVIIIEQNLTPNNLKAKSVDVVHESRNLIAVVDGSTLMAQSEKPVENILSFAKKYVPLHP